MATTIKDRTRVEETTDLVGTTVDKYEVVGVVGQGGMGRVYEAVNTSINKSVAMKCIDHELAKNDEANARFQREALAASAVESPHIVQIFDAGVTGNGLPYIVMELLRGQDLGRYIADNGRLELGEALMITAQILKGLHHAHDAGIVHRDLKPDNVFLVRRDDEPLHVKLLDFGVSKISRPDDDIPLQTLTRQGTVVGTPFYMSPEQAQAFPDVDQRTDLYSVGAILYECLTGRAPHVGRAYEQVIVNICMNDADDVRVHNPSVPDGIADFLKRALARERDERFQSAREMLAALKEQAPLSIGVVSSGAHLAFPSTPDLAAARDSSAGTTTPAAAIPSDDDAALAQTMNTPLRASDTPRIVPAPASRPANELADTVGIATGDEVPDELLESGISQRASRVAETVRSRSLPPGGQRRWRLALAPGVAILLGVVLWMGFKGGVDAEAPVAQDAEIGAEAPAAATAAPDPERLAEAAHEAEAEPEADPADVAEADEDGETLAKNAESKVETPATKAKPGAKASTATPVAKVPARPRPTSPPVATTGKTAKPVPAPPATSDAHEEPSLQLQTK